MNRLEQNESRRTTKILLEHHAESAKELKLIYHDTQPSFKVREEIDKAVASLNEFRREEL
jgi:hypothetical protein